MGISIKFKNSDAIGEYYISIGGRAETFVGTGYEGRINALARIGYEEMVQQNKEKWLATLEELESKIKSHFEVRATSENGVTHLLLTVDGDQVFNDDSLDKLALAVSRIEEPKKDHRPPGF